MQYQSRLIDGQFLKRYKRFFADVTISSDAGCAGAAEKIVAHVANTGSLLGICDAAHPCRIAYHDNPNRKLKYSLEQIQIGSSWVGVNTHLANDLVAEAFSTRIFKHWSHLTEMHREFCLSKKTRLDFRFSDAKSRHHFVEVKSVSMAISQPQTPTKSRAPNIIAQFPDAPTVRGQKHLEELIALVKRGHGHNNTAEIFYVVQRTDANEFAPADDIDPEYAELLLKAKRAGVRISAYPVEFTAHEAKLASTPLKILI